MFSTYRDIAPFVILLTFLLVLIIGRTIRRKDLKSIDGVLAVAGCVFGLFMTLMNLAYTSKDLFLLSPTIAIGCVSYLRYRSSLEKYDGGVTEIDIGNPRLLSLAWWLLVAFSSITLLFSEPYTRHPLFFFLISGAVALLAVQILTLEAGTKIGVPVIIGKTLFISILLRYSAFFITPYPIGSDPWVHREYIGFIIEYGRIAIPSGFLDYYVHYPVSHLFAVSTALVTSLSPLQSMFMIGLVLTISSIFAFLIVRMLTGDTKLALIALLLLNFADSFAQWSILIIAMSFGIALFSIIMYMTLKVFFHPESRRIFFPLLIVFLCTIVWTHTISAFVTLISLVALFAGYVISSSILSRNVSPIFSGNSQFFLSTIVVGAILLFFHWTDPAYPFFDTVISEFVQSISNEAAFLGAKTVSNVLGRWEELFQSIGTCMYVLLGIAGALYSVSEPGKAKRFFPILSLAFVLFFVRYTFPIFGIRNIVPDRWSAFALVVFTLFVGFGLFLATRTFGGKRLALGVVAVFFLFGSFFMIIDANTNLDSPLYSGVTTPKFIWTESEMDMYRHINATYDGTIIADQQTAGRPLKISLNRDNVEDFAVSKSGGLYMGAFSEGLVLWRKSSIDRPTTCRDSKYVTNLLLGPEFYDEMMRNYSCVVTVGEGRAFIERPTI